MLNGLDLFSGIGGLSIALNEWVRTIAYCEIDPYCQGVLLSRMAKNDLSWAPIWDDIKTIKGGQFNRIVDIIYGGFPCQGISVAGLGKGLADERSGLFFEIVRLAKEIKPKFLFIENVPAITTRGGLQVVNEITALGYDCRWCIISAASVGALHKRDRWFLLAHAHDDGSSSSQTRRSSGELILPRKGQEEQKEKARPSERTSRIICNTNNITSKQADQVSISKQTREFAWRGSSGQYWPFESREHWQKIVSAMGKQSDGISFHLDRLRALGNSVVPQQAKKAFKILMGINYEME